MDKSQKRQIESETFTRSFVVERNAVDEQARTVELAFSSEEPYERWFGIEVLDHSPQSVRLDRLNGGAALLVDHNTRDQIGVVESARVDSDRRGRAKTRFSRSSRGEEILQDVVDGIRTLVSVGYKIHKYTVEERAGQADLVRVTEWEPYEISIVSIPADVTVGVGRSDGLPSGFIPDQLITEETATRLLQAIRTVFKENSNEDRNMTTTATPAAPAATEIDEVAERQKFRTQEKKRMDSIRALAEQHDLPELGRQAIDEDWTVEAFNQKALEKIGERNNKAKGDMKEEADVDLTDKEHRNFSLVKLMDHLIDKNDRGAAKRAAFELEVCAAAAEKMPTGFTARGIYLPPSVMERARGPQAEIAKQQMRDLSAGTATDGAELVATNLLAGSFIEVLRNTMQTMKAGCRFLPGLIGNVEIPRQTSGATMSWITAEDGDASESEPQFDQVSLTPKDAAVYTEVTRRLMQQSSPSIEGIVRNDLYMAIALGLDLAILYGAGSSGQPQGINGATGVADPTISSAAAPTYAELVTIVRTIMRSNALMGGAVWIGSPETWEKFMTTPKQGSGVEGNFILTNDKVVGFPFLVSQQLVASDFVFGDFTQVLVGEWGGMELNVDPYTHSLKGKTRFVMFKTVDTAIRHPQAFAFHDAA